MYRYSWLVLGFFCATAQLAYSATTLSATPNPVTLSCSIGTPCTSQVTLTSSANVNFSSTASVKSNGFPNFPQWLSVTPTNGTATPAGVTLTLTVNYTGLAPASGYQGSVTITAGGASNSPYVIGVSMNLQGTDSLLPSNTSLTPQATARGSAVFQNVTISTIGLHSFNPLNFSATANSASGWLSVSPTMGTATAAGGTSLKITANPANLSGSGAAYNGSVILTDSAGKTATITVSFTVSAPSIDVSTPNGAPLSFNCNITLTTPTCQAAGSGTNTLTVSSAANLSFSATPSVNALFPGFPSWLQVSPQSGTATPSGATVTVSIVYQGLVAGNYKGTVTISAQGASSCTLQLQPTPCPVQVPVTLTVIGTGRLSPSPPSVKLSGPTGGTSTSQNVSVSAIQLTPTSDSLSFGTTVSPKGQWLTASSNTNMTPAQLTITADPSQLNPSGTPYSGSVILTDSAGNAQPVDVFFTVTPAATVTAAPNPMSFSYTPGTPVPAPQTLNIDSPNGSTPVNVSASSTGNWLSVTPQQGVTPMQAYVSISPNASLSGKNCGSVSVAAQGATSGQTVQVCLTINPQPTSTTVTQVISHLADGGGWSTRIILVNSDPVNQATFELKFWDESGKPWMAPLGPDGNTSDMTATINPGESRTIQTAGTATTTAEGWAELTAPSTVNGTSIFTLSDSSGNATEAGVPLSSAGGQQLFFPYDNTSGFAAGLALANPNQQDANVTFTFVADNGATVLTTSTVVSARCHWAATVNQMQNGVDFSKAAGTRGVLRISSNVNLYAVGVRSRGNNFTSLQPLAAVPTGNKVIAHVANGGDPKVQNWTTTMMLVNTDTVDAPFTVSFYDDQNNPLMLPLGADGVRSSLSDKIHPGQIRILQTDGSGNSLTWGWALVQTSQAVGGTSVFTENAASEGAVPVTNATGKTLYLPYDNTGPFVTSFALANPNNQQANLTFNFLTETGQQIQPSATVKPIAPGGHYADVLNGGAFSTANGTRGVVRIDSNVDLSGLVIRFRGSAFTSLPVTATNQ